MRESAMEGLKIVFESAYFVINQFFRINYIHIISYLVAGVIIGTIFNLGRQSGIWFGRAGGKIIGIITYAVVCTVLTFIINLFSK